MTRGTDKVNVEIQEVTPDAIERLNAMCVAPGSDPGDVLEESAKAHERAAALGAKVFGAFLDGKPVGRKVRHTGGSPTRRLSRTLTPGSGFAII
ncbi:MAG: hypothetical protein AB1700_06215 [Bacillota bacterium]